MYNHTYINYWLVSQQAGSNSASPELFLSIVGGAVVIAFLIVGIAEYQDQIKTFISKLRNYAKKTSK